MPQEKICAFYSDSIQIIYKIQRWKTLVYDIVLYKVTGKLYFFLWYVRMKAIIVSLVNLFRHSYL